MRIHGWGRYPVRDAKVYSPSTAIECTSCLNVPGGIIPQGALRSYGDSALAPNVLSTKRQNNFQDFDPKTGILKCEAGVTLVEILAQFVPKGWFLPVTPGTRFVTVGGCIASDVHGKNHHISGSFGDHVQEIEVLLGSGEPVITSRSLHPDLFRATCGGMGLTGIILSATIRLICIRSSLVDETTVKAPDLDSILAALDENRSATYSAAWIDCIARGKNFGRSHLILGEHAEVGSLTTTERKTISIPIDMPINLLNRVTVGAFNKVNYNNFSGTRRSRAVPYHAFFYPLDQIRDWNRLYGKAGFLQYQFVLPAVEGSRGIQRILERISASGRAPFFAVLKVLGPGNGNPLSFPITGLTLALDFRNTSGIFEFLEELDKVVLDHGGRIYLAKDARMSEATFKAGYSRWSEFQEVRSLYHALGRFSSDQSRRLGLE